MHLASWAFSLRSVLMLCVGVAACGGGSDGVDGGSGSAGEQQVNEGIRAGDAMRQEYGADVNQFGDLTLPADTGGGPAPVVMLIHGGFWRTGFGLELMGPLVPSLTDAGYAVWNVEYRRVGNGPEGGGGYPATFDDLAAAADLLATLSPEIRGRLDLARVATVGHSAGGHLAAWLASRAALPEGAPWAAPAVRPTLAVSQAGVLDLERCIAEAVGGTACRDLLLGADGTASGITAEELSDRIALTSPAALLPIGARVVAVHGTLDRIVPLEQSTRYVSAAEAAGVTAEAREIDGANHFDVIDPSHPAWQAVLDVLAEQFGSV